MPEDGLEKILQKLIFAESRRSGPDISEEKYIHHLGEWELAMGNVAHGICIQPILLYNRYYPQNLSWNPQVGGTFNYLEGGLG